MMAAEQLDAGFEASEKAIRARLAAEHKQYIKLVKIDFEGRPVKTGATGYRVDYKGVPIGRIRKMSEMQPGTADTSREWGAKLLGYDNYTWIGKGPLSEIAIALVEHELDQRITNPTRKRTRSPYAPSAYVPDYREEEPTKHSRALVG